LGTAFFATAIIAPWGAAVSCQMTVYTKILTRPLPHSFCLRSC
jgi:hypothetical protein